MKFFKLFLFPPSPPAIGPDLVHHRVHESQERGWREAKLTFFQLCSAPSCPFLDCQVGWGANFLSRSSLHHIGDLAGGVARVWAMGPLTARFTSKFLLGHIYLEPKWDG